jgi:hypothetical protein
VGIDTAGTTVSSYGVETDKFGSRVISTTIKVGDRGQVLSVGTVIF